MNRISEINDNSLHIIEELCGLYQFPSVDKVLAVLLQRYGVMEFYQLQCGEIASVPSLSLLVQIVNKVDRFLAMSFATCSIVSIWDLDVQCADYLHSFNIPTLTSMRQPVFLSEPVGDPNEVDLDADDTARSLSGQQCTAEISPSCETSSFESYGLGRLLYHPIVWRYFSRITQYDNNTEQEYLRCEDVLQLLLDYQTQKKNQSGHNRKFTEFDVSDFISFVCTSLGITDLMEAGVFIQGDLHAERVALEHVVNNRYKLFVEVTKKELSHFNQQMQEFSEDGRRSAKRRRKRTPIAETTAEGEEEGEREKEEGGVISGTAGVSHLYGNEKEDEGEGKDGGEDQDQHQDHSGLENVAQEKVPPAAAGKKADKEVNAQNLAFSAVPKATGVSAQLLADSTTQSQQRQESCSAVPPSADGKHKVQLNGPAFESSMTVYLPTGQPSITHISAAHVDHSTIDACNSGIYVIENWELQPILPFVTAAMAAASAGTGADASLLSASTTAQIFPSAGNGVYTSSINATAGINPCFNTSSSNSRGVDGNVNYPNIQTNVHVNLNVMDSQAVGRWGESLVYQYLLHSCPAGSLVNWLNQAEESRACYDIILQAPSAGNRSASDASRAHYKKSTATADKKTGMAAECCATNLTSSWQSTFSAAAVGGGEGGGGGGRGGSRQSTEYIEVKSTRYANRNVFEISPNEWQFASADSRVPYHLFRVFSAGDVANVKIVVVKDVFSRITEGRVKICLAI